MKVLVFSDIHQDLKGLQRIVETNADLYICAGDLVSWAKGLAACGEVLRPLSEKLWVIPGNHESAGQIESFCRDFGFNDFHGKTFKAGGMVFAGLGYSNPTPFDTPGEYSEGQLERLLAQFKGLSPLALVCHAPPLETPLDESGPGKHFGSSAVKAFVDAEQPRWFFCGHIHEAAGREAKIGETTGYNVGRTGRIIEI